MIRIGAIGAGGIFHAHYQAIRELTSECQLVAVFDQNPEALHPLQEHGIPTTTDEADFWNVSMDAVIVSVPNRYHRRYVEQAASRHLAVLTEKPMASTLSDAAAMVEAVSRAGVVHLIGFVNRYRPQVRQLKILIDRGQLGDLYGYREVSSGARLTNPSIGWEWRMDPALSGGGASTDFGSHTVDMATWLVGPLASLDVRLATFVSREGKLPANDDMAVFSGRFASGALFSAVDSRVGPGIYRIEVYGAQGYAELNIHPEASLKVVSYRSENPMSVPDAPSGPDNPFVAQMHHFVTSVITGKLAEPNLETAYEVERHIADARAGAR